MECQECKVANDQVFFTAGIDQYLCGKCYGNLVRAMADYRRFSDKVERLSKYLMRFGKRDFLMAKRA